MIRPLTDRQKLAIIHLSKSITARRFVAINRMVNGLQPIVLQSTYRSLVKRGLVDTAKNLQEGYETGYYRLTDAGRDALEADETLT